jgi:hypothetical protein
VVGFTHIDSKSVNEAHQHDARLKELNMRALTMKARTVLAASVCILALLFLVPAAANAQVTISHVRVTISPKAGSTGPTAVYCDLQTNPCTGGSPTAAGIQVWNFASPVVLSGGQTLVLAQTAFVTGTTFGNFDTSDRVGQLVSGNLVDCNTTGAHACQVTIELDTGAGLSVVYNSGTGDDPLVNSNVDTGALNHCEGTATYTNHTVAAPNYTLGTGYADNVHTGCNTFPTPFTGATVFKGAGVGNQQAGNTCGPSNCYDSGAILITGVTVSQGCTFTQGYWKNHGLNAPGNQTNVWPVNHLLLGTVNYTQLQLQSILDTAPKGNGLITLAHQLIAAKLNIANGANGSSIVSTIVAADALIGSKVVPPVGNGFLDPSAVSALVDALDDFNSGITGPGHCGDSETD